MARKFGPFDTSVFYETENRRMQRAFNQRSGFVKAGQGTVSLGTGAELVIAAYPDGALVDGIYVENPSSETVPLTTNTGSTNPRIDRLVMRLDMNAKTLAPFQVVGTPAASPSAPTLTQTSTVFDMPMYRFQFPGSGSAQNPSTLVDERVLLNAGGDRYFAEGSGTSMGLTTTANAPSWTPSLVLPAGTYDFDVSGHFELSVSAAGREINLHLYSGSTSIFTTSFNVETAGGITSRDHSRFTRETLATAATVTVRASASATGGTQAITDASVRAARVS